LIDDTTPKEAPMEGIDQDRLARILDAARHANGGPAPSLREGAVRVAVERPQLPPAKRRGVPRALWLGLRALGALAVLAVGAVHLQQYSMLYSAIPTIGTLFILNFAAATAIGAGLLAPLETLLARRWGGLAVGLLTLAGIGVAATSFAFLAISEQTPLFGFMEPGYDPPAILASRVAEAVAVLSLGAFGVARFVARAPMRRW
jgi:hypothetical protein